VALQAEREARLRVEAERDVAQMHASNWQAETANARILSHQGRRPLPEGYVWVTR
jgi:hypothetical protein